MASLEQIAKPVVRALNIYRRVARRELDDELRRGLARHIKKLADEGIEDANSLTVHGLSFLRRHERTRRDREKTR
jgi:hypothetical protein